jgi:stalled ribosome rescue protein Dom34
MSDFVDAIIWIDRREAKVFQVSDAEHVKLVITHTSAKRQGHRADHEDGTKHALDPQFFHSVVQALDVAWGTLLTGPGTSKFELQQYMDQHRPDLAARISGVETIDEPTDAAILEFARRYFRTRGHRHASEPGYNARKDDSPIKA